MKPVNNKSMIAFLFDQMDKLDKDEIDINKAKEQSNLAKQVNNAMKYELDRARLKIDITVHNKTTGDDITLREIESKNFD